MIDIMFEEIYCEIRIVSTLVQFDQEKYADKQGVRHSQQTKQKCKWLQL